MNHTLSAPRGGADHIDKTVEPGQRGQATEQRHDDDRCEVDTNDFGNEE